MTILKSKSDAIAQKKQVYWRSRSGLICFHLNTLWHLSSHTIYLFNFRIQIQMESQNLLKHQRSLWCRTWDFPKRSGRQSRLQIQELHYGKLAKLLAKHGKKWPKKKDKNTYEFITYFHESWISICSCFGGFFPRKKSLFEKNKLFWHFVIYFDS